MTLQVYLNDVIKRWLQEAKRLSVLSGECGARGDDDEAIMSAMEADTLNRCAKEILQALKNEKAA